MANLTEGDQSFCSTTQSSVTGTTSTATVPATSPLVAVTPSSIGGGGAVTSTPTSGSGGVWAEFCERHARAASADFARSCVHYITTNLPESARQTVSHRDFMRRFVDCFQEHFGHDFDRRRMQCKVSCFRDWFRIPMGCFTWEKVGWIGLSVERPPVDMVANWVCGLWIAFTIRYSPTAECLEA